MQGNLERDNSAAGSPATGSCDPVAGTVEYWNGDRSAGATGHMDDGNWVLAANLADQAILRQHVDAGATLSVRRKTFPSPFKCNRDAWLDGTVSDEGLDCDLLAFLNLGIALITFILRCLVTEEATGRWVLIFRFISFRFLILFLIPKGVRTGDDHDDSGKLWESRLQYGF